MSWLGRIAIFVLVTALIYSMFRVFETGGPIGSERLIGRAAPEFAAPLAGSGLTGDSNIYTRADARSGKVTAACDVKLAGAFVSCRDLRRSAALVFWDSGNATCTRQVAVLDRFKRGAGRGHDMAVVALRPEAGAVGRLRADNGWRVPLAIDRDGAVGGLYRVGACPTTFFLRDGKVTGVRIGLLDERDLARGLRSAGPTG